MNTKLLYDFNNIGGKIAVVISHGFQSSKDGRTPASVAKALDKAGISSIRFDFPAHGDSLLDGEHLRVEECLDHLAEAERIVREALPDAEICYFSSSYGAYLNLLYMAKRPHTGTRSFLRCTAVDMAGIMNAWINPDDHEKIEVADFSPADAWAQMEKDGFITFTDDLGRPLKVTKGFFEDLNKNNLNDLYNGQPLAEKIVMIHGDADEVAPYEVARSFAEKNGIKLITSEGSDHRFLIPEGVMDKVIEEAIRFYTE